MTLLNDGSAALAKIFAGTKSTNLTIDELQLDTTGGTINATDHGAATPTTPNPVTGLSKAPVNNICTCTATIVPANNIGTWLRWWIGFKLSLNEMLAAGAFTNPGITHDGSGTDVLDFDIIILDVP